MSNFGANRNLRGMWDEAISPLKLDGVPFEEEEGDFRRHDFGPVGSKLKKETDVLDSAELMFSWVSDFIKEDGSLLDESLRGLGLVPCFPRIPVSEPTQVQTSQPNCGPFLNNLPSTSTNVSRGWNNGPALGSFVKREPHVGASQAQPGTFQPRRFDMNVAQQEPSHFQKAVSRPVKPRGGPPYNGGTSSFNQGQGMTHPKPNEYASLLPGRSQANGNVSRALYQAHQNPSLDRGVNLRKQGQLTETGPTASPCAKDHPNGYGAIGTWDSFQKNNISRPLLEENAQNTGLRKTRPGDAPGENNGVSKFSSGSSDDGSSGYDSLNSPDAGLQCSGVNNQVAELQEFVQEYGVVGRLRPRTLNKRKKGKYFKEFPVSR